MYYVTPLVLMKGPSTNIGRHPCHASIYQGLWKPIWAIASPWCSGRTVCIHSLLIERTRLKPLVPQIGRWVVRILLKRCTNAYRHVTGVAEGVILPIKLEYDSRGTVHGWSFSLIWDGSRWHGPTTPIQYSHFMDVGLNYSIALWGYFGGR